MMKIALRHPSGLHIEFEGDEAAFDRFAEFLKGDVRGFVQGLETPAPERGNDGPGSPANGEGTDEATDPDSAPPSGQMDPRQIAATMERVGATTDIERVTVLAQAAVDAGMEGLSSQVADGMYDQLGIPKPSRWSKAFSNAKQRGLLRSLKYNSWVPTVNGENYAKHGTKPPRRARRSAGTAPEDPPALTDGAED